MVANQGVPGVAVGRLRCEHPLDPGVSPNIPDAQTALCQGRDALVIRLGAHDAPATPAEGIARPLARFVVRDFGPLRGRIRRIVNPVPRARLALAVPTIVARESGPIDVRVVRIGIGQVPVTRLLVVDLVPGVSPKEIQRRRGRKRRRWSARKRRRARADREEAVLAQDARATVCAIRSFFCTNTTGKRSVHKENMNGTEFDVHLPNPHPPLCSYE